MHIINGAIAVVLFALAFIKVNDSGNLWWMGVYGLGAVLALISLRSGLHLLVVRFLAGVSVLAMLGYFAAFFLTVPYTEPHWLQSGGLAFGGLLLAGFAMIPVLSEFSCRMKSGNCGREHLLRSHAGAHAGAVSAVTNSSQTHAEPAEAR